MPKPHLFPDMSPDLCKLPRPPVRYPPRTICQALNAAAAGSYSYNQRGQAEFRIECIGIDMGFLFTRIYRLATDIALMWHQQYEEDSARVSLSPLSVCLSVGFGAQMLRNTWWQWYLIAISVAEKLVGVIAEQIQEPSVISFHWVQGEGARLKHRRTAALG